MYKATYTTITKKNYYGHEYKKIEHRYYYGKTEDEALSELVKNERWFNNVEITVEKIEDSETE